MSGKGRLIYFLVFLKTKKHINTASKGHAWFYKKFLCQKCETISKLQMRDCESTGHDPVSGRTAIRLWEINGLCDGWQFHGRLQKADGGARKKNNKR